MANRETRILSGKDASMKLRERMRKDISYYKEKYDTQPRLVVIQVGDDQASNIYIKNKLRACEEVGIKTVFSKYSTDTSEEEILNLSLIHI